jgi:hypothetical protein
MRSLNPCPLGQLRGQWPHRENRALFDGIEAVSLSDIKTAMIFSGRCTGERSELFAATLRIGRAHG